MHDIKVRVVEFGDRKHYQLQWTCPLSGRKKTKSSGIERTGKKAAYDAAVKAAGEWEKQLNNGDIPDNRRATWDHFRERYDREVMTGMAKSTQTN
jgi:hypothetical protein